MFAHETNACKFPTSCNFSVKEGSFRIVNIPIIVIKPEASLKWDSLAETFLVAAFFMYFLCAYLNGSDLWKCGDLVREDLKVCLFDLTFANLIELIILHICDMLWDILTYICKKVQTEDCKRQNILLCICQIYGVFLDEQWMMGLFLLEEEMEPQLLGEILIYPLRLQIRQRVWS